MVNVPTQIPDCHSHNPALLDLFLSSDASICSTMALPPLGNSDHVVVSVSIDFPSNSQWDALFHRITYGYSHADWDSLPDHLRDVPWEDIFKLSASAAVSEFCEWVQVGNDIYISLIVSIRSSLTHFRQASNHFKRFLEAANFAYANKTKEFITSQKLGSQDFWRVVISALNKSKSAIPPLFNGLEVLSSASDKTKLFAGNFSKNCNLDDSGISLSVFPSITNLKLYNISVTPKMVKKVITNLDSSKAYGPDFIPVVVLRNCEPEVSYILAELFNMCLKESCFPDCWKVSLVVPVLKNVGERFTTKNSTLLVFFLW